MLPGCALLSPARTETSKALLQKLPAEVPQRAAHDAVLLVYPPQTARPYDTTQMAYTLQPYDVAYFSQHEWGATPAHMLQPLLVATFEKTHFFSAVVTPPYLGPYKYALRTEIRDLVADFTSQNAAVQLSLRFQLSEGASGGIVATREITIREPMRDRTPYAAVVAANDATAKGLLELAGFVLENAR